MSTQPIGVFDSGLGGLSVWKEIRQVLPHESMLYYADSANCPYGTRSAEEITALSETIVQRLLAQGAKAIIVACNTATSASIAYLREHYNVPFIGMEPAIKPAAHNTKTGNIGVLATQGTLEGEKFHDTRQRFASHVHVFTQVGYGLVEAVENQTMQSPETNRLLQKYLGYMLANNVDQIVLGCTHYPFLLPQMQAIVGEKASFINPAVAVARHAKTVLTLQGLLNESKDSPTYQFETSGNQEFLRQFVEKNFLVAK
ncbi:MAG: glutamate racemase [Bacteroidetes bacterium]|nr:MAG: glutamate racemase [Bacteroidota bacterium]